jgi:uncharacterized C2H2 Zn-finger protein
MHELSVIPRTSQKIEITRAHRHANTMVFEYKKNDSGLYVCGICGETKEKQNTMHYHMKRHEGTKSHKCEHCLESFYQKIELTNHIKIIHKKEGPSIHCPSCDAAFHTKAQCSIHVARLHLQDYTKKSMQPNADATKTYTCLICNKICNSHPSILYHMIVHAKTDALYMDLLKNL